MKRQPPAANRPACVGLRRIWPLLFWHRCRKCGLEFRWEWGWIRQVARVPVSAAVPMSQHLGAACNACAPTRDEAVEILGDAALRGVRPPPPPAPPLSRVQSISPRDTRLRV